MLVEGVDYYINEDGLFVFTKEYHLKRGFCCQNKCLHCPWDYGKPKSQKKGNGATRRVITKRSYGT
ncbi:MAG: DUF5522 domain-containing protein [Sphingobacteriales bacterium]